LFVTLNTAVTSCPTVTVNGTGFAHTALNNGLLDTTCNPATLAPVVVTPNPLFTSWPHAVAVNANDPDVAAAVYMYVNFAKLPAATGTAPAGPLNKLTAGPSLHAGYACGVTPTAFDDPAAFATVNTTVICCPTNVDIGAALSAAVNDTGFNTVTTGDVLTLLVTPAALFWSTPYARPCTALVPAPTAENVYANTVLAPLPSVCDVIAGPFTRLNTLGLTALSAASGLTFVAVAPPLFVTLSHTVTSCPTDTGLPDMLSSLASTLAAWMVIVPEPLGPSWIRFELISEPVALAEKPRLPGFIAV
jgi:hypothetical protein